MEKYLKDCGFDKYFKKLVKKLNGKTIIVYGTGSMFQYILKNYDLSGLNIIGVCDNKYLDSDEGNIDLGYKIIPKSMLENYEPDYILLGVQNYINLLFEFAGKTFRDKKTKILPLVKLPLREILRKIWCE